MNDKIWTPFEIAEHFKVQERAVRRWLNEGKLIGFKMGNLWRIKEIDLLAFIEASGKTPLPQDK